MTPGPDASCHRLDEKCLGSQRSLCSHRSVATDGRTTRPTEELTVFLRECKISQRAERLLRDVYDGMGALLEARDADLRMVGLPARDAEVVRRRLRQLHGWRTCRLDWTHPVVAFLRETGLEQYAVQALANGFDDMETLAEMREVDMQFLGMSRGHALKLAKRLRELRASKSSGSPAEPLGAFAFLHDSTELHSAPPPAPVRAALAHGALPPDVCGEVQRSWERVQRLGSSLLGEKLYKNVFWLEPEAMKLFPPEVRFKYREWTPDEDSDEANLLDSPALRKLFGKVLNTVGVSVAGMRQPSEMVPVLTQLGARHAAYGVSEHHWRVLGDALHLTLHECLGADFTPEVQRAWTMAYAFISAVMVGGFRDAQKVGEGRRSDGESELISSSKVPSRLAPLPASVGGA